MRIYIIYIVARTNIAPDFALTHGWVDGQQATGQYSVGQPVLIR